MLTPSSRNGRGWTSNKSGYNGKCCVRGDAKQGALVHKFIVKVALATSALVALSNAANAQGVAGLLLKKDAEPSGVVGAFGNCDGYGAPGKKADGMTTASSLFNTGSSDIRKIKKLAFGAQGATFCDVALNDPLLQPAFWLRRAHLLQAKALHQIASGEVDAAFASLDQSNAVGREQNNVAFNESVAIGNRAIRAYGHIISGRRAEAEAEIAAIAKARAYAPTVTRLASRLQTRIDPNFDNMMNTLRRDATQSPDGLKTVLWISFIRGDYKSVVDVMPQITFERPIEMGGYVGQTRDPYATVLPDTEAAGIYAYALSALGKADVGKKKLEAMRARLDELMIPPPPPEKGLKQSSAVTKDFTARTTRAKAAMTQLELWTWAAEWRKTLPGRPFAVAADELEARGARELPLVYDIMRVTVHPAEEQAKRDAALAKFDEIGLKIVKEEFSADINDLYDNLPRAETAKSRPSFAKEGLLTGGYDRKTNAKTGTMSIRYYHPVATMATVEELSLLAAASEAKKAGKDSFILLSRKTIVVTTYVTSYYGGGGGAGTPSGHDSQILVRFVDKNALPADLEPLRGRLLDADTVIAQLSPKYAAPAVPVKGK